MMRRVLSGIQPSGFLHIGNYFGMIKRAIEWQDKAETLYFIADYHALTSIKDPQHLSQYVRKIAMAFLACGLDPAKSIFFRQSAIPEVHELAWILSSITPFGLLERSHSFKDKVAKGLSPTVALFSYPVLMTADILLYQSEIIPVGQDQKQHLEIARDIAKKFNNTFGEVFRIPEPDIQEEVAIIPGIDGQKMSKSYNNTLEIFGDLEEFKRRVMSIKTDSTPIEAPKPTKGSILVALYKLVATDSEYQEFIASMEKGGHGYAYYKKLLLEKLLAYFQPIRERYKELEEKPGYVEEVLADGAYKARMIAQETLTKARRAVGLLD
ncbi:tryptophanyl-tRNA synthetase [Methylacidiphilum kamchatkense Kam1]|uniref:Tryptophan--tRNA ligase n=1 Tax=Methylacidiphilum kamchatkense Kam1 TaxID=1202785 RepID=A0A0C1RM39_9BACT|nr:tryptophan--tRNA ligase [Methylacidiphilum kamchatkense]KIE59127.1 tryptophanyl-tRNA synthetase [Methylacidiphilum kamchatkense Kam1]QDQ42951.1 tryptophanyl-tRNA synthetase [Methylacidiphilum kamchatkense Kam1]